MPEIKVPDEFFDEPQGGGTNFPAGTFVGKIEKPARGFLISDLPDWTPPQKRIGLQFGENEPLDDSASPGRMKHFVDLPIEIGGRDFSNGLDNVQLRVSLNLLTRLALALGFLERGQPFNTDEFVSLLDEGTFDGQKVAFNTYHSPKYEKDQNGKFVLDEKGKKKVIGQWVNTRDFWAV